MSPSSNIQKFMHPKVFAFWLLLVSSTMFFAALSSAYIVKRSLTEVLFTYSLPPIFFYTTGLILLSSLTMYLASRQSKQGRVGACRVWLGATFTIGLLFLMGQWMGWRALVKGAIHFVGHPLGSFVYVLSGAHAIHLVSGLIFTAILFIPQHKPSKRRLQIGATYWHFLTILWLYLYVFLMIYTP